MKGGDDIDKQQLLPIVSWEEKADGLLWASCPNGYNVVQWSGEIGPFGVAREYQPQENKQTFCRLKPGED